MGTMVRPNEEENRQVVFGKEHRLLGEVLTTGGKAGADRAFWAKLAHDERLFRELVTYVGQRNGSEVTDDDASHHREIRHFLQTMGVTVEEPELDAIAGLHAAQTITSVVATERYREMASLARSLDVPISKDEERARQIMGHNIFGPRDAVRHLGYVPRREDIERLARIPFGTSTLIECADSHVLVALCPMTEYELYQNAEAALASVGVRLPTHSQLICRAQRQNLGCSWMLLRKSALKDSLNKPWPKQVNAIREPERVVQSCMVTYALIAHFLRTGESLFQGADVMCCDTWPEGGGKHVIVGRLSSDGCFMGCFPANGNSTRVGIATHVTADID